MSGSNFCVGWVWLWYTTESCMNNLSSLCCRHVCHWPNFCMAGEQKWVIDDHMATANSICDSATWLDLERIQYLARHISIIIITNVDNITFMFCCIFEHWHFRCPIIIACRFYVMKTLPLLLVCKTTLLTCNCTVKVLCMMIALVGDGEVWHISGLFWYLTQVHLFPRTTLVLSRRLWHVCSVYLFTFICITLTNWSHSEL